MEQSIYEESGHAGKRSAKEAVSSAEEAALGDAVSRIVAESKKELDTGKEEMPDYDYHDEMIQIEMLFQSHILSFGYKEYTLENYADRRSFSSWKAREGCEDTDEMRAGLNIDGILRSADPSESEVLTYLQYVLNVAELSRRSFNGEERVGYEFDIRNYTQLISRVRDLLRRLHYDYRYVEEKEFIFILPHDDMADAAIPDIPSNPLYGALTEYRSTSSSGNLERKRRLLQEIGRTIENYPDNLKAGNSILYSRIEFLLNNVQIRYDNREGEEKIDRVARMSEGELEDWYDETFRLLLVRILEREKEERIERVDQLALECGTQIESVTDEEVARILNEYPDEKEETKETPRDSSLEQDDSPYARRFEGELQPVSGGSSGHHPTIKVIIAIVVADILFVLFLLYYFHIFTF